MYPSLDSTPRTAPPPLWFVTNGNSVIGPFPTHRLLRGIAGDRIPLSCLIRERTWTRWRAMDRIREVASLRRCKERYGSIEVPRVRYRRPGLYRDPIIERFRRRLAAAHDPGDALREWLVESMKQTGALVGAVHRCRAPFVGLVTSAVSGPGMPSRLGSVVGFDDPVVRLAQHGRALCAAPTDAITLRVEHRLGTLPASEGVAMIPVGCAGQLIAMLELGRPDHAFRAQDIRRVQHLAKATAQRFSVVCNRSQLV